jgi:hypothetical protein
MKFIKKKWFPIWILFWCSLASISYVVSDDYSSALIPIVGGVIILFLDEAIDYLIKKKLGGDSDEY